MQAQHEASTADLQAQLEAAKQQIAELEATHQQAISDHMATAAIVEKQEQGIQQQHALHAAFVHGQLVAAKQLQLEVATATEEAGQHMTAVAADTSKLQQAYCHSQAELKQEVQQLKAELQEWQQACSSSGQASGTAVLARLVEMQSEVEAKTGLQGLLDEHVQVKVQVSCTSWCRTSSPPKGCHGHIITALLYCSIS